MSTQQLNNAPTVEAVLQQALEAVAVPHDKMTEEIDLVLSDPDTKLSAGAVRALRWLRTWVSVPLYTAPQLQQAQELEYCDPSSTIYKLAEMVMSDCGCSSDHQRLLDRIAARIQSHIDTAPQPQRQPLARDRVKEIMTDAGYEVASAHEQATFINGLRHGELAHGIGGPAA